MQLIQPPDNGIDQLDVGNSLMKAVQYALGWLIVWISGLIQLPMMIVQFVMECLCYLFLPIALSLFAFESTKGLAIRTFSKPAVSTVQASGKKNKQSKKGGSFPPFKLPVTPEAY